MAYIWSKDLETGNMAIDDQHKQLIQALNNLLAACAGGKGRAQIQDTLSFLINYTVKHFADEEKLQTQYKYPGYAAHRVLHENFKKTVAALDAQFKKEGPSVVMVGKINNLIGDWLVNHIKQEDKKIAEFIRGA